MSTAAINGLSAAPCTEEMLLPGTCWEHLVREGSVFHALLSQGSSATQLLRFCFSTLPSKVLVSPAAVQFPSSPARSVRCSRAQPVSVVGSEGSSGLHVAWRALVCSLMAAHCSVQVFSVSLSTRGQCAGDVVEAAPPPAACLPAQLCSAVPPQGIWRSTASTPRRPFGPRLSWEAALGGIACVCAPRPVSAHSCAARLLLAGGRRAGSSLAMLASCFCSLPPSLYLHFLFFFVMGHFQMMY